MKKSFTLAEVLITLGIIGIVAAMTFPALLKHHRKTVIETSLKKFYTIMNQAILQSTIKNGETKYWEFPAENSPESTKVFWDRYFKDYVKILRLGVTDFNGQTRFTIYYQDGSVVRINWYGHDWYYCLGEKYYDDYDEFNGSKCFTFAFYPTYKENNDYVKSLYAGKGIEPYVSTIYKDEDGNSHNTTLADLYKTGRYAKIIQMNGWTIPKDYPVKY